MRRSSGTPSANAYRPRVAKTFVTTGKAESATFSNHSTGACQARPLSSSRATAVASKSRLMRSLKRRMYLELLRSTWSRNARRLSDSGMAGIAQVSSPERIRSLAVRTRLTIAVHICFESGYATRRAGTTPAENNQSNHPTTGEDPHGDAKKRFGRAVYFARRNHGAGDARRVRLSRAGDGAIQEPGQCARKDPQRFRRFD